MSDIALFSLRSNIQDIQKKLDGLASKQLPFATAQALTAVAKKVQAGETEQIKKTFPTATPFTLKSVGVIPATKISQEATVFIKDIAASYLKPYEFGGLRKLTTGKAMLGPVNIGLNQYGNIPRSKIRQLSNRPDIYIGAIKTKSGETINGVWQRPAMNGKRGAKANTTGHLKLLIRFESATTPRQHLGWKERAEQVIKANFDAELGKALARAMATAK